MTLGDVRERKAENCKEIAQAKAAVTAGQRPWSGTAPGKCLRKRQRWEFPGVQWLRLHTSAAGGMGSIPGQETKIPRAAWCVQTDKSFQKRRKNENSKKAREPRREWAGIQIKNLMVDWSQQTSSIISALLCTLAWQGNHWKDLGRGVEIWLRLSRIWPVLCWDGLTRNKRSRTI